MKIISGLVCISAFVATLCMGDSLKALKLEEKRQSSDLRRVQAEIAKREGLTVQKELNLNLLLTSLNETALHYATRKTMSQMDELTTVLREKTKPVVDGKLLALDLTVRTVKLKRNGTVKLAVVPGDTLPFLDIKSSERNMSVGLVHTLELTMPDAEAQAIQPGDDLTLSGTALFVGTRDDRDALDDDPIEAVVMRMFGGPATSGFGAIFMMDNTVTLEKTGMAYRPE